MLLLLHKRIVTVLLLLLLLGLWRLLRLLPWILVDHRRVVLLWYGWNRGSHGLLVELLVS